MRDLGSSSGNDVLGIEEDVLRDFSVLGRDAGVTEDWR